MTMASDRAAAAALEEIFDRRVRPIDRLLASAEEVSLACRAVARRFYHGGKLVVFGNGGPSTDAQHVAVEFMHPVIVGKRALPAISLTSDVATVTGVASGAGLDEIFAHQVHFLADSRDIALGISTDGSCSNVLRGLQVSKQRGLLTVALVGGDGGALAESGVDHVLRAHSDDSRVVKEVHVTMYHMLWELVHVFLEQPGSLDGESAG